MGQSPRSSRSTAAARTSVKQPRRMAGLFVFVGVCYNRRMTRRLWLGVLLLLLVVLCGTLWFRRPPVQTCRLPDGTVLSLDAVTYGTQHRAPLPPNLWWRQMLPFLNHRRPISLRTTKPTLVLWLSGHQWRANKPIWEPMISSCCGPSLYHIDASDELGHHVRLDNGLEKTWQAIGYDGYLVELTTFPRRGKTITVTFPGNPDEHKALVAQPSGRITVPNPTPGPFPRWNPVRLPLTQQSGNLAVTLTSLTRPKNMPNIPAPGGGFYVFFPTENRELLASFQVTQHGKPTRDWVPVNVDVTDAAGQISQGSGHDASTLQACQYALPLNLPDDEAGYKFRVEFRSHGPVAQTPMTLPVPVEEAYFATTTSGQATLLLPSDGKPVPLTLISVAIPGFNKNRMVHIQIDSQPLRPDLNWLLHLTDDRGKWIQPPVKRFPGMLPDPFPGWTPSQQWTGSGPASSLNTFDMPLPPGAKKLHLTIGTVQSRWVEFTARPS